MSKHWKEIQTLIDIAYNMHMQDMMLKESPPSMRPQIQAQWQVQMQEQMQAQMQVQMKKKTNKAKMQAHMQAAHMQMQVNGDSDCTETNVQKKFQKNSLYQKFKVDFKANSKKIPKSDLDDFIDFIGYFNFDEEFLYWLLIINETYDCSLQEKYVYFARFVEKCQQLCCLNFEMAEKVFEYGKENLKIFEKKFSTDPELKCDVIKMMLKALRRLERYSEAMYFHKEKLKIAISFYNNHHYPTCHHQSLRLKSYKSSTIVLESYVSLIESQIQNKCFTKALKTCNRVTLFNLNSLDPKEVLNSLEVDGYNKHFPLSNLSVHDKISMLRGKREVSKTEDIDDVRSFVKKVTAISTFCTLKCLIFQKFDDMKQCHNWSSLPLMIYNDVLVEIFRVRDYVLASEVEKQESECGCPNSNDEDQKKLTIEYVDGLSEHIIVAKLILSECDISQRHNIFDQIIHQILHIESRETTTIMAELIRKYRIPFEYLSPFLKYYSIFCEKQGNVCFKKLRVSEESLFASERKKIITYQNSLKLTNHIEKVIGRDYSCRLPMQVSFYCPDVVMSNNKELMFSDDGYKMRPKKKSCTACCD